MKAEKIKLALEKLKEAKVKKVRRRRHEVQDLNSQHKNTHGAKSADAESEKARRETKASIMVNSVSLKGKSKLDE